MIPALIGAASGLLGGLLNKSSADSSRRSQEAMAAQNIALQREFAQQGIRWRVEDARAAGIHPLFALGAQTHSFSPVSVGSSADTSMGDAIASAGQNIGRAASAALTSDERAKVAAADALSLEKAGLENELLRTQIGSLRQKMVGNPPAMPGSSAVIPGQGETVVLPQDKPGERPHIQLGQGWRWRTDPQVTGGQAAEDRYGEVSDFTFAPYALFRDWLYNLQHNAKVSLGPVRQRFDTHTPRGRDWAYRRSRPSRW